MRSILTILLDTHTRQHLQVAARETALQFNPSAISDRLACADNFSSLRRDKMDLRPVAAEGAVSTGAFVMSGTRKRQGVYVGSKLCCTA